MEVTITHGVYVATGSADFAGPYDECEGAHLKCVTRNGTHINMELIDPDLADELCELMLDEAYVQLKEARAERDNYSPHECDDQDDYDPGPSGPDYWQNADGEWQLG